MQNRVVQIEQRTMPSLKEHTIGLLADSSIDWAGRAKFDAEGNLTGFKVQSAGNNYRLQPVPDMTNDPAVVSDRQALDDFMRPCTKQEFAVLITKLGNHCGMQGKSPTVVKHMMADYWEDMHAYPKALVELACAKYRRLSEGNSFMPSSGKLMDSVAAEYAKLKRLDDRLNKLLRIERKADSNDVLSFLEKFN